MEESVISTMDNTAFFDNVTWLNQQNWQNYFGKTLPNGVIVDGSLKLSETGYTLSGTMDITTDENNIIIGSGAVMANGLYAENLLPVQIPHVTQAEATKFICVRFSLESANAKIVCKTNVVGSNDTVQNVIRALNVDESYLCDRNPDVYEIPLAFESYNGSTLDLRRLVYAPSSEKHYLDLTSGKGNNSTAVPGVIRGKSHAQVFGGTTYFITIDSNDANSRFTLYPMFTNSTEPIIVCIQNNSGSTKDLTLSNSVNGFSISYEWIDSWLSSSYGKYTDFVSGSSKILVLFPAKITTSGASFGVLTKGTSEGGSVDPDSVYTKQEINNLLAQKANSADVNSALSTKEDITNLGALAYQSRVNYLTQIDNKPDQNNIIDVTYYVSKINGSDGNLGTQESPFKTIQHAIDSVGINCVGTIIIASDTYTEKLEIKGKHVILKQAELPEESTYEPFDTEILIRPYAQQNYDEDYCIKVIDNSIAEFIGFFTIKAYHYGILISDNSCLFLDGKYFLRNVSTVLSSNKYCTIKVDLNITPSGNGTPSDEIINPWDGNGVYVRNASNFITKSYNKVVISNLSNASEFAGYGFRIEKSYCFAYDTGFDHLYRYVYCYGGVFRYYQSDKEGYDKFEGDGVIKSLDFGSLAYKDTVNYETEVTNKPNIPNIVNEYISNRIIYVNGTNGDDTTGDGSPSNPYATIQKAIDNSANGVLTDIYVSGFASSDEAYEENITISGKNLILRSSGSTVRIRDLSVLRCVSIQNNSSVIFNGIWEIYARNAVEVKDNSNLLVKGSASEFDIIHGDVNTYSNGISVSNNSRISIESNSFTITLTDKINNYKAISVSKNSSAYIAYLDIIDENTVYHADFMAKNSIIYYYNFKRNGVTATPVIEASDNGVINIPSTFGTLASKDDAPIDGEYYLRKNGNWNSFGNYYRTQIKYYVDNSGNDNNDGSQSHPFRTIQKAVDQVPYGFKAQIVLVGGTYNYPVKIDGKNIEFVGINHQETIVISGEQNANGTPNIDSALSVSNGGVADFGDFATVSIIGFHYAVSVYSGSSLSLPGTILTIRPADNESGCALSVSECSRFKSSDITVDVPSSAQYVSGIRVSSASFASFGDIHFSGNSYSSTSGFAIKSNSGIVMYKSVSGVAGSDKFYKQNGGLISTGSDF